MIKAKDTISYITRQIKYICKAFSGRSAGSDAEYKCQAHFASQLVGWSDSVAAERFSLHPRAFFGWIIPCGILGLASIALHWLGLPGAGLACVGVACILFIFEFLLYRKMTDKVYPKKQSVNLFARRKPKGETRRRIIFGGHADAAYEMPYILSRTAYVVAGGAIVGLAFMLVLNGGALAAQLFGTALPELGRILAWISLIFAPFFIAIMFYINWNKVVDGANDNLTGCLVSMSVMRDMAMDDERLEHTELCCLITGAEEAGLRGAMEFAKRHKDEFQDVETVFIAVDTLREADQLAVYTRGINGTQPNSPHVVGLLKEAAAKCGVALNEADNYPGATDAEAFSREGLMAAALGAANHDPQPYYHTRHDTADNIDPECIQLSLEICKQAAQIYDRRHSVIAPVLNTPFPSQDDDAAADRSSNCAE